MFRKLKQLSRLNDTYLKKAEKRIKQYEKWLKPKKSFFTCCYCGTKTKDRNRNYFPIEKPSGQTRYLLCRVCIRLINKAKRKQKRDSKLTKFLFGKMVIYKETDSNELIWKTWKVVMIHIDNELLNEKTLEEHIDVTGLTNIRITSKDKTKGKTFQKVSGK